MPSAMLRDRVVGLMGRPQCVYVGHHMELHPKETAPEGQGSCNQESELLKGAQADSTKPNAPGHSFGTAKGGILKGLDDRATDGRPWCNCRHAEGEVPPHSPGQDSPGALEYFPKEVHKKVPAYSFASKNASERKPENRVQLLQMSTPRNIGPGSHPPATSMGHQPMSPRRNAPAWSMAGKSPRENGPSELLAIEDKVFSSIGKQVLSTIRSPPGVGVSTSTRDQANKTGQGVHFKASVHVGMTSLE
eukprot:Skav223530  [mRNA]  locus=scaffold1160:383378:389539:+ [translate_table: standard]